MRTGERAQIDRRGGRRPWWVAVALTGVAVVALAGVGDPAGTLATLGGIAGRLGPGALAAGAYLASAYGWGTLGDRVWSGSPHASAHRVTCGLAVVLSLGHGLGVLGVLRTGSAVAMVGAGLVLAAWGLVRAAERGDVRAPGGRLAWIAAPALGVVIVASACPPGWLWGSEFGSYDALAYHLQLPQEWIRAGHIWPNDHNVYSYLPSYVESAFVAFGEMTAAPTDGARGHGLLAGDAWRAQGAHAWCAMVTVIGAWVIGRVAWGLATRCGADGRRARAAAWGAGTLTLATPWVVVVGTIAYAEAGVTALGAGAVLIALDERVSARWRGAIAGALVGVACGCKPTAMLFVTPVVGLVLVAALPRRAWIPAAALACVAGAVAIAPWMARNWAASGNPVFPQLAGVFGQGPWTEEQVARYSAAHHFHGGVLERLRLLVANDPAAGAGAPVVERFRGAANPQWGALFPIAMLAMVSVTLGARTRRWAWVLAIGLAAQLVAWVGLTHLQSRFLLPCVIVLGPMAGLALGAGRGVGKPAAMAAALTLMQSALLIAVFATQRGGHPNAKTAVGLALDLARPAVDDYEQAYPWAWVNGELDPGVRVYVVGQAAVLLYGRDVVSNSTWDSWPIGGAMREHPGDPDAWTGELRAQGIDAVLIDFGELARLHASGWIDPGVTPERVRAWTGTLGEPRMVWDGGRVMLFMLSGAGDG